MGFWSKIIQILPEVRKPDRKLSFNEKLKWTLMILVAFFILSVVPLYGLGLNSLAQFEQLSIILGASFGSMLSLGIGPIVTASIVLQLLSGSGILKLNTTTHEGRAAFQGLQKILAIFFIIFEGAIYVLLGGLAPDQALRGTASYFSMELILILQLIIGGLLVLAMDEVLTKWGFGSGVSLFIAAGVSAEIFIRAFSPLTTQGTLAFGSGQPAIGALLVFITSLIQGATKEALIALAAILGTILIFVVSVYAQTMKVEIPLSFGKIRGFGYRWPLNFLYTSNIPVILIAALLANIQLFTTILGSGTSIGWLNGQNVIQAIITGTFGLTVIWQSLVYLLIMLIGSTIFSIFWVQTAGQDAGSVSKQIMASGLQIPGFRRDERILERVLKRYITPLTVMGGLTIGLLAASADLIGALSRGTGILLAVMIIYKLYEDIAKQHMMDMHPSLRKVMGG